MLNRTKLIRELQNVSDELFQDYSHEHKIARTIWQQIVADPAFKNKIREVTSQFSLPTWDGKLDEAIPVKRNIGPYRVFSVDGSQIYPDKHQGTTCFLINTGSVSLSYGVPGESVLLDSEPQVFVSLDEGLQQAKDDKGAVASITAEYVDCKRQELEFDDGLKLCLAARETIFDTSTSSGLTGTQDRFQVDSSNSVRPDPSVNSGVNATLSSLSVRPELVEGYEQQKDGDAIPSVFLCDGSLIFWHLESKDAALKDQFLNVYLASLHQFYQEKQLIAGYISLPKAKELVNLVRIVAENPEKFGYAISHPSSSLGKASLPSGMSGSGLDHIVDTVVADYVLSPFTRSIVFKNHAAITKMYPEHLHPHFFYLHVGDEIGRVEIPAWIALDEQLVDTVACIIVDQSIKGRGYPVAIAEAHEQAVVKGPDRDFFYQLITKFGIDRKRRTRISQKSLKKRGIGI